MVLKLLKSIRSPGHYALFACFQLVSFSTNRVGPCPLCLQKKGDQCRSKRAETRQKDKGGDIQRCRRGEANEPYKWRKRGKEKLLEGIAGSQRASRLNRELEGQVRTWNRQNNLWAILWTNPPSPIHLHSLVPRIPSPKCVSSPSSPHSQLRPPLSFVSISKEVNRKSKKSF